jgi:hypothetical protein
MMKAAAKGAAGETLMKGFIMCACGSCGCGSKKKPAKKKVAAKKKK